MSDTRSGYAAIITRGVILWLLCAPAAQATDYWNLNTREFDITVYQRSGYAVSLAGDLGRFDQVLNRILQWPDRHLPTHIVELAPDEARQLLGDVGTASYRFSGFEAWVVATEGDSSRQRYWGALFGYTGSRLSYGKAARSPYWFQVGVPTLFAQTEFDAKHVLTAGTALGFGFTLTTGKLIPMRIFLRVRAGDPQLQNRDFNAMYEAESWFLAREVFVEGKLRAEFGHYLQMLRQGNAEGDAFAASFKIGYEDLDKVLADALREPAHQFVLEVPRANVDGEPRKLTPAASKALLAEVNLQWRHRADALRLSAEALRLDAGNELALRVMAQASLEDGQFATALEAVDKIAALPAPSAAALTDSGEVLARLATEVSRKQASIGADADALVRRAGEAYERATVIDPGYLRSWAGLAYLYGAQHDRDAAQALVAKAQPIMEGNIDNGALARALAIMCGNTGLSDAAFLFGQYWRDDALTQSDLDQAKAFMARLHDSGGAAR